MNSNNTASQNGHDVQFLPRLGNLFRSARPASSKENAQSDEPDYRAQDTAAYHLDGAYSHRKPVATETQFGIDCRVPAPAFGMTKAAIAAYMLHARVAAFAGATIDAVRAHGARLFDARYAQLKAQFEGRITAATRLVDPLESQALVLRKESDALPALIKNERDKFSLPQDWRLLGLLVVLLLWGFVAYSEWLSAAARQLYQVQDWGKAKAITVPWLAAGIVVEWILVSSIGAVGTFWHRVWRVVSLASIVLYAGLYALRHGASPDAGAASAIASALNGTSPAGDHAFLDQSLYFGQLFFGLICGATLLEAALHLMVGRDVIIANPDRRGLQAQAAVISERINQEDGPLWKAKGHLAEYEACREAFIDFGVRAYLSVAAESQIFEQERQILARERELLDRKRRALLS